MCVRIREFQCGFTNAGFVVMVNKRGREITCILCVQLDDFYAELKWEFQTWGELCLGEEWWEGKGVNDKEKTKTGKKRDEGTEE